MLSRKMKQFNGTLLNKGLNVNLLTNCISDPSHRAWVY